MFRPLIVRVCSAVCDLCRCRRSQHLFLPPTGAYRALAGRIHRRDRHRRQHGVSRQGPGRTAEGRRAALACGHGADGGYFTACQHRRGRVDPACEVTCARSQCSGSPARPGGPLVRSLDARAGHSMPPKTACPRAKSRLTKPLPIPSGAAGSASAPAPTPITSR